LLVAVVSGCASQPASFSDDPDPWEGVNRPIFAFNRGLDKVLIRPAARAYDSVLPSPAKTGVTNFFKNLDEPFNALHCLLQGKPRLAGNAAARFVLNTTVGLAGLFDVAARSGVEGPDGERGLRRHEEDLGQTLAVWGVPAGPYLMLPLLGPSSARDVTQRVEQFLFNPLRYVTTAEQRRPLIALRILDVRSRLLPLDDAINSAVDPYAFVRSGYIQNRTFEIFDGDPPIDDLYDEYDLEPEG
jgi:phospholipid-binding lipoprotein MlaA